MRIKYLKIPTDLCKNGKARQQLEARQLDINQVLQKDLVRQCSNPWVCECL